MVFFQQIKQQKWRNDNMKPNLDIEEAESLKAVKQGLITGEWIEEAKQIPLDYLSIYEKQVITKLINKAPLTESETNIAQEVLGRYRPALRDVKPEETIRIAKENIQLNKDHKSIINILKNKRDKLILPISYPLNDEEDLNFDLIVEKKMTKEATSIFIEYQESLSPFMDFTEKEAEIAKNIETYQPKTEEERQIAESVRNKLIQISLDQHKNIIESAILILANQTRIYGDENCTYQDMIELYENMSENVIMALFEKVQLYCGINNINKEKLFRKVQ